MKNEKLGIYYNSGKSSESKGVIKRNEIGQNNKYVSKFNSSKSEKLKKENRRSLSAPNPTVKRRN